MSPSCLCGVRNDSAVQFVSKHNVNAVFLAKHLCSCASREHSLIQEHVNFFFLIIREASKHHCVSFLGAYSRYVGQKHSRFGTNWGLPHLPDTCFKTTQVACRHDMVFVWRFLCFFLCWSAWPQQISIGWNSFLLWNSRFFFMHQKMSPEPWLRSVWLNKQVTLQFQYKQASLIKGMLSWRAADDKKTSIKYCPIKIF